MKIVIDIPDKKWELIQNNGYCGIIDDLLFQNIKNGIPLAEVIEDIKAEIKSLYDEPARYVPNYDAYAQWLEIIDKHISGGGE